MQGKMNTTTQEGMSQDDLVKTLLRDRDILGLNEKIDEVIKDEKFLTQLDQSNKKVIAVAQLSEALKNCLAQIIAEVGSLRDEVLKKKKEVLSKNLLIKQRVDALLKSGKVHVNQTEYKTSEISVLQYSVLLDNICGELEKEGAFFKLLLNKTCPQHVLVHKDASDFFDVVLQEKIKTVKQHIKTIYRDLLVSYSRYCYGFDAQLKRIANVESLVKKESK